MIERLAQDCTAGKWTVGDRVMALLPGGGNAEIVSVHEDHLMPLPKSMTFREASAIPEVRITPADTPQFQSNCHYEKKTSDDVDENSIH